MPLVRDEGRALATVETITAIRPIDGADAIVTTPIRGWNVVVRTDEVAIGDRVVYFEIDTALPLDDPRYAFLEPRGSKDVDGRLFHILRTAKLRGTYSQGLVLPLDLFAAQIVAWQVQQLTTVNLLPAPNRIPIGMDVTDALDLYKWEAPIPAGGMGLQTGPFLTTYAQKTDSERAQNLTAVWSSIAQHPWVATEKVDGTSCTIIRDENDTIRVCGRNWEITEGDNLYWKTARTLDLDAMLRGDVVQAEIVGPGIQGNRLGLTTVRPVVFGYSRNRRHLPRDQCPSGHSTRPPRSTS